MNSKEILKVGLKRSWHAYEMFLILIAVLEGMMMIYGIYHFDFHDLLRQMYFSCYIFLFCLTVAAFFVNRYCMKEESRINLAVKNACIYNTLLIFWAGVVSALDISNGGYAVTYMTILAAVGSMVALNPVFYAMVSIASSTCMVLIALNMNQIELPLPFYLNHMIFLLVIIAVEFRNYRSTKDQYLLMQTLDEWAEVDALTRIANRRALDNYIEHLRQEGKPFTFALLDVDNFKSINDTYGHKEGDKCLLRIAEILSALFPGNVFRYGGDEFALVSCEDAEDVSGKIMQVNAQLKEAITDYELQVCGGVCQKKENTDGNRIFEHADAALYEAKQNGKARTAIY